MTGLELQQTLATWEKAWPIIFLTGQDDAHSVLNASDPGSTEFFTKPVEARLLLAAVARAVKKDRIDRLAAVPLVQAQQLSMRGTGNATSEIRRLRALDPR